MDNEEIILAKYRTLASIDEDGTKYWNIHYFVTNSDNVLVNDNTLSEKIVLYDNKLDNIENEIGDVNNSLTEHINDNNNPHNTNLAQLTTVTLDEKGDIAKDVEGKPYVHFSNISNQVYVKTKYPNVGYGFIDGDYIYEACEKSWETYNKSKNTSLVKPTLAEKYSSCSIDGGYVKIGDIVFTSLTIHNIEISGNNNFILSGFPIPINGTAYLSNTTGERFEVNSVGNGILFNGFSGDLSLSGSYIAK